jgi:hypothetical protein
VKERPWRTSFAPDHCQRLGRDRWLGVHTVQHMSMLPGSDDGFTALTSEDQVTAAAQQQIDAMRAADYHHSDVLGSEITVLNATSALHRGAFSRRARRRE